MLFDQRTMYRDFNIEHTFDGLYILWRSGVLLVFSLLLLMESLVSIDSSTSSLQIVYIFWPCIIVTTSIALGHVECAILSKFFFSINEFSKTTLIETVHFWDAGEGMVEVEPVIENASNRIISWQGEKIYIWWEVTTVCMIDWKPWINQRLRLCRHRTAWTRSCEGHACLQWTGWWEDWLCSSSLSIEIGVP